MNTERFVHDGRHLREWLLQVVEEDPERRREASTAINDHLSCIDLFAQPEWSCEQTREVFEQAIRETVGEADFPRADYVKKLLSLKMRLSELQYASLRKWSVQARNEDKEAIKGPPVDEPLLTGIALASVIDALGEELMPAAEQLRMMLQHKPNLILASNVISRMGEAAIEFYPELMAGLKLNDASGEYSKPLGYLLRHYPEKIRLIFEMTEAADQVVRENAIATLMHCGRETIKRFPEIETAARERLGKSTGNEWHIRAWMLGDTAVTSETISLFLEMTRSSEIGQVGTAIDCLGAIGLESERVVPRLVELLDEYEEYDSDWGWSGGEYARIIAALAGHGAAAKAAIPRLAQLIWSKPYGESNSREPNEAVIKLLGKLGPEAREALPGLLEMKAKMQGRPKTHRDDLGNEVIVHPDDCCPEYVEEAIAKIEGKP